MGSNGIENTVTGASNHHIFSYKNNCKESGIINYNYTYSLCL